MERCKRSCPQMPIQIYYFREIQLFKHACTRMWWPAYSCAICDFCLHINLVVMMPSMVLQTSSGVCLHSPPPCLALGTIFGWFACLTQIQAYMSPLAEKGHCKNENKLYAFCTYDLTYQHLQSMKGRMNPCLDPILTVGDTSTEASDPEPRMRNSLAMTLHDVLSVRECWFAFLHHPHWGAAQSLIVHFA